MEIKVGEYVRTPLGISKYLGKCDDMPGFYKFDKLDEELWFDDIADIIYENQLDKVVLKHSPNIIDLIEVGDYVNGKEIHEIDEQRKRLYSYERDDYHIFNEKDIQRVVTHEQFAEMEYKV